MAHEISNNKVNAATEKEFVDDKTSVPSSASHDGESGIDLAYEKKLMFVPPKRAFENIC